MFNFGFAIEHVLGHITHYQNLRHWATQDPTILSSWMSISPDHEDIWEHLPVIRSNWSLKASLRTWNALRATLHTQPLDALFLHTQTIALFALPFMRRIPTVISVDATPINYDSVGTAYDHNVGGNRLLERQKFLWNRSTYQAATGLIAWSNWVKNSLVNDYGIAADKITIIPPGIDLEQWHFEPTPLSGSVRQRPVRLLFVGGDFTRKGGYTLIDAFRSGLNHSSTLDIVTRETNVSERLASMEGVSVHRNVSSNSPFLKKLYYDADIFVFPTQGDCHSLVIVEAMAAGLPIITTQMGAIAELVEDQVNGLLVPPADVNALVAAVSTLVNDEPKRHAMAIASRRFAEERFDGHRNYGKILSLMKQVTEGWASEIRKPPLTSLSSSN
jgi:glycosyltransferase involved in cell wall biosynthesis